MATLMQKFWWAVMLRGILAIAFGLGALFCRNLSSLAYLFGIFALSQGVLCSIPAFAASSRGRLLAGIEGMMGVLVALLALLGSSIGALLWPSVANVTLLIYIVSWIVVTGVVALAMLVRLRVESSGSLYMGLSAVLCVIFSVLLVSRHAASALGNAGILGVFGILYGVVLVLIGRKAHSGKP